MPQIKMDSLFLGVTDGWARTFVAELWAVEKRPHVVLPCVGSFGVAAVLKAAGAPPAETSDLNLVSTLVGYLADPSKNPVDAPLDPTFAEPYLTDAEPGSSEWCAGILLAFNLAGHPPTSLYAAEYRAELAWAHRAYRERLGAHLDRLVVSVGEISYDLRALRDVDLGDGFAYFSPPTSTRQEIRRGHEAAKWAFTQPEPSADVFERLVGVDAFVTSWIPSVPDTTLLDAAEAAGWVRVGTKQINGHRADYIVANRDPHRRRAINRLPGEHRRFPIFDESEITPDSTVEVVKVDEATCLYYRDLFVHKLGTTAARDYFLLLIDGRVISAFGLHTDKINRGREPWIEEQFAITVTSQRYARLGKLFMALLTSRDFERAFRNTHTAGLTTIKGIKSSAVGANKQGMIPRGSLKTKTRERLPNGSWRVVYLGEFRDDTWADVLSIWLRKHGKIHREGWNG